MSNIIKKFAAVLATFTFALLLMVAAPRAAAQDHGKTATPAAEDTHGHAAAGAHAEPAGVIPNMKQGIISGVATLVVFSLVFAILATKVWPLILGGLKDRENKIRDEIQSAESARQQAKDALEQYQKSLSDARAEASKMLESTRAQQAQLAADLRAKADVELSQMRERAMKDIATAKRAAVSEIYEHAGQIAATMAGKILRRNVNSDDTQRLVEESLQQLQASRN